MSTTKSSFRRPAFRNSFQLTIRTEFLALPPQKLGSSRNISLQCRKSARQIHPIYGIHNDTFSGHGFFRATNPHNSAPIHR